SLLQGAAVSLRAGAVVQRRWVGGVGVGPGVITHRHFSLFYRSSHGHYPCFAARFGGVSGGNETHGWRVSSHTTMVAAGKFGSAKLPMATVTCPGKPSFSQKTVEPQVGQK